VNNAFPFVLVFVDIKKLQGSEFSQFGHVVRDFILRHPTAETRKLKLGAPVDGGKIRSLFYF
jgi:hypothetical protein